VADFTSVTTTGAIAALQPPINDLPKEEVEPKLPPCCLSERGGRGVNENPTYVILDDCRDISGGRNDSGESARICEFADLLFTAWYNPAN
jgi:hypothetical protein